MKLWLQVICFCTTVVCFSQQTEYVDFKSAKADISFNTQEKKVSGNITYTFDILKDVDSVFLDAKNFKEIKVRSSTIISQKYNGKKIVLEHDFKKGENYEVIIDFVSQPKKAMYFIGWDNEDHFDSTSTAFSETVDKKQIWTQGQGKYTSNWLPSIDDMNDKIEFDLSITFDSDYEVIANGNLKNNQIIDSTTTTWHYDMTKPMSSYLVALAIGKYIKRVEYSKSGIPIELYYYPDPDSYRDLKFEPTYRYTKQMFDFLEEEIGVPYPWQNYKQVPVKDFLYAGMENTGLTIFSDRYVIDSTAFVDRNYVNVNAHELAHQWFGNLVTETSGTHHWLQEGFATYYALLSEKEVFGDDYYNWQLYEYAQELIEQDKIGQSTSLLDPKSSSATFYKKGAWVLHLLREKAGGSAFKEAVKSYLLKHEFKNVETDDFISEVEKASGENWTDFVQNYFNDTKFFTNELKTWSKSFLRKQELIFENDKINCGFGFQKKKWVSCILDDWDTCLDEKSYQWRAYLVSEIVSKDTVFSNFELYKSVLRSKDLKARQALAQSLSEIPLELKENYESLLEDKSYVTIEVALMNLWRNFPEERSKYLNKTRYTIGFNDKNIRTLWLALALITEGYEDHLKPMFYKELLDYTNPNYHFEIRQNAFQYLNSINACNEVCERNLEDANKHHVWQFKKFASQLLKQE